MYPWGIHVHVDRGGDVYVHVHVHVGISVEI